MESLDIYYSEGRQRKLGWFFLLLALIGAACALYMWLYANPVLLMVLVGGIVLAIIGLVFSLKLLLAPRRTGELALRIGPEGIAARTTPVAKAAGLVEWSDIIDVQVYNGEIALRVEHPEKYAERMKNFFVRDTFRAARGVIRIAIVALDIDAEELHEKINAIRSANVVEKQ